MSIAPTQSAAATPATTATSGSSSTGALDFTKNFNTFLTLLTTQLKNQDPLSPMDTNTFTQQLVSFSEVEQQINTNTNLQSLIQLQTENATISALPLVGHQIAYASATAPIENGQASYSYTLPSAAAQAALVVSDANGNVVYNTSGDTAVGTHDFVWDGKTNAGQQLPDGAPYTLQVVARDASNNAITATVQSIGTVKSVAVTGGEATFDVSGITVPMSELVTVDPGKIASSSN
jgi:flagellar basal-body rod modification protein FlgD